MERRVPDITKVRNLVDYRNTHTLDDILHKVIEYERTRLELNSHRVAK